MDRIITLHAEDFNSNPNKEPVCYINNPKQLKKPHSHDYYELFLVNKGYAIHSINGFSQSLSPYTLVFIRPQDRHHYDGITKNFEILNIIVSIKLIDDLFCFLGDGFEPERLTKPSFSPTVQLSQIEFQELILKLEQLVVYKKIMKDNADTLFRIAICDIITKYFSITFTDTKTSMPVWFKLLTLEMLKKKNFTEGLPAMQSLSGKTLEHMGRVCKKHLGKTPTQFINDIRIAHSVHLLISTNKKIVTICYEVGFNNLSYFYQLFQKKYGMTPAQLRKEKDSKSLIKQLGQNDFFTMFDTNISQGITF